MNEINFKGLKGLVLENDKFKIVILPELGGKVASFFYKKQNFELLFQNKEDIYRLPQKNDDFSKFDTAGFDDCFPNIQQGEVIYGGKKIIYPDHGEIWFSKFDYTKDGDSWVLTYKSDLMDYIYKKSFTLGESGLDISFDISNVGKYNIDCFYTVHCLTNCEEGMEIIFPETVKEILNVSNDSTILGKRGTVHPYPVTRDLSGNEYHLNRIASKDAKKCEKFYAKNPVDTGKCGIFYPSINSYFSMEYDEKKLPYLGLWITENGFKECYNCALEPSNGFHDSIETAYKNNKYYILEPNKTFNFNLKLNISSKY